MSPEIIQQGGKKAKLGEPSESAASTSDEPVSQASTSENINEPVASTSENTDEPDSPDSIMETTDQKSCECFFQNLMLMLQGICPPKNYKCWAGAPLGFNRVKNIAQRMHFRISWGSMPPNHVTSFPNLPLTFPKLNWDPMPECLNETLA